MNIRLLGDVNLHAADLSRAELTSVDQARDNLDNTVARGRKSER